MKTLLLGRHAKSSWDNHTLSDHDRPLNKRGKLDAPVVGASLAYTPNIVFSSSALRALQTARLIAQAAGLDPDDIEVNPELYATSANMLLRHVSRIDDEHQCAMLISHNPAVESFIDTYTSYRPDKVVTCSIFILHYSVESWGEVLVESPSEVTHVYPALFTTPDSSES